jgi:hypothetical protein
MKTVIKLESNSADIKEVGARLKEAREAFSNALRVAQQMEDGGKSLEATFLKAVSAMASEAKHSLG